MQVCLCAQAEAKVDGRHFPWFLPIFYFEIGPLNESRVHQSHQADWPVNPHILLYCWKIIDPYRQSLCKAFMGKLGPQNKILILMKQALSQPSHLSSPITCILTSSLGGLNTYWSLQSSTVAQWVGQSTWGNRIPQNASSSQISHNPNWAEKVALTLSMGCSLIGQFPASLYLSVLPFCPGTIINTF